jgi:hypothetical protein
MITGVESMEDGKSMYFGTKNGEGVAGGSKIPFSLQNSAMLPTSKKTATMEDKLLEAALTVVDGCPAGAAAVVPEGVRTAVVVPEDAAMVIPAALHTPIAKKTGEKRLFECGPAYCQVSNYSVKTSEN